jgi:hypothetical protein
MLERASPTHAFLFLGLIIIALVDETDLNARGKPLLSSPAEMIFLGVVDKLVVPIMTVFVPVVT